MHSAEYHTPYFAIPPYTPGGPLVFKGGYHARVQKHGKRVVFHGEASAARPVFRVSKTAKIKKKGMFFKAK